MEKSFWEVRRVLCHVTEFSLKTLGNPMNGNIGVIGYYLSCSGSRKTARPQPLSPTCVEIVGLIGHMWL